MALSQKSVFPGSGRVFRLGVSLLWVQKEKLLSTGVILIRIDAMGLSGFASQCLDMVRVHPLEIRRPGDERQAADRIRLG